MKFIGTIFTLSALIALCHAQAINISGTVKNSAGTGMENVTVRLGKANIATTTGSDGSFTLKANIGTGVYQSYYAGFSNDCPFLLEDNRLFLNSGEQAEVKVTVYDCHGKLLVSNVSPGNNSITLPHFGSGIHLYRVFINDRPYTFKSVTGIATNHRPASSLKETGLAKLAKATVQLDDALLFTKDGYQLSRLSMTKSDTSGIQIAMASLVTGTVTDGEGNVYQTVRIGNQEWTTENIRSTKFNDGSSIGSACNFYKGTTDAAAKKKWGALYEWSAVKTGKLAPTGWQVASDADWDTLENYLIAKGYNYDGTTSGNKLAKSISAKTDWEKSTEPNALGNDLSLNNASGFSALPAGWRYWSGNEFRDQGTHAFWWTSTAKDGTYSYVRDLWNVNFDIERTWYTLIECSVRLVRHI